ncbi:MAG TPA: Gmad2 immunoglobulin-like domain-containing protein [Patescibacteria group bacterium]|nr:Gmad2 immunoglobulin-like domain-containing protein [Patescibacteria group bacterium]
MKKKMGIIFFLLALAAGAAIGYIIGFDIGFEKAVQKRIANFEECAAAGYPVMESYPEQCRTPDGKTFTRDIGNELEFSDEIIVGNPRPNQVINNPLSVSGQARGIWYFEANFPVELFDEHNKSLGVTYAAAQGEWMTGEFVAFTAELSYAVPSTRKGKLVIRNANPSGLPEQGKELVIPVIFEE